MNPTPPKPSAERAADAPHPIIIPHSTTGGTVIRIYGQDGQFAGEISEAQLDYLREQFVEESPGDTEYYVSPETVEMLEESGADPELLTVIRAAVGEAGEGEIRWSRG